MARVYPRLQSATDAQSWRLARDLPDDLSVFLERRVPGLAAPVWMIVVNPHHCVCVVIPLSQKSQMGRTILAVRALLPAVIVMPVLFNPDAPAAGTVLQASVKEAWTPHNVTPGPWFSRVIATLARPEDGYEDWPEETAAKTRPAPRMPFPAGAVAMGALGAEGRAPALAGLTVLANPGALVVRNLHNYALPPEDEGGAPEGGAPEGGEPEHAPPQRTRRTTISLFSPPGWSSLPTKTLGPSPAAPADRPADRPVGRPVGRNADDHEESEALASGPASSVGKGQPKARTAGGRPSAPSSRAIAIRRTRFINTDPAVARRRREALALFTPVYLNPTNALAAMERVLGGAGVDGAAASDAPSDVLVRVLDQLLHNPARFGPPAPARPLIDRTATAHCLQALRTAINDSRQRAITLFPDVPTTRHES